MIASVVGGEELVVLQQVVGEGAGHGGHGEEERELRRRALVAPSAWRRRWSRPSARRRGPSPGTGRGRSSGTSGAESASRRSIAPRAACGRPRAARSRRRSACADDPGVEQHVLDEVVQQRADDRGRQEGDEDAERRSGAPSGRSGSAVAMRPQPAEIDRRGWPGSRRAGSAPRRSCRSIRSRGNGRRAAYGRSRRPG